MQWQTVLGTGHDVEKLELAYISERMYKWYRHFGKQCGSFSKSLTETYYTRYQFHFQGQRKTRTYKHIKTCRQQFRAFFFCNSKNLSELINGKQDVVYPHNRIIFSNKKGLTTDTCPKMDEFIHIILSQKVTYCMIQFISTAPKNKL